MQRGKSILKTIFHLWLIELYYGGEAFTADQPQSFTCPYCGKMGFTETALQEHVASEHSDASIEVVSIECQVHHLENSSAGTLTCGKTFCTICLMTATKRRKNFSSI